MAVRARTVCPSVYVYTVHYSLLGFSLLFGHNLFGHCVDEWTEIQRINYEVDVDVIRFAFINSQWANYKDNDRKKRATTESTMYITQPSATH